MAEAARDYSQEEYEATEEFDSIEDLEMYFSRSPTGSSSPLQDNDSSMVEFDYGQIHPYNFEPSASESSGTHSETDENQINERMQDLSWLVLSILSSNLYMYTRCFCGKCEIMNSHIECVCCREIQPILNKIEALETPVLCITEHPGFNTVCLDVWVLQTSYYQYRQYHHGSQIASVNEYATNLYLVFNNLFNIVGSTDTWHTDN